jgi:hypothetical protein
LWLRAAPIIRDGNFAWLMADIMAEVINNLYIYYI